MARETVAITVDGRKVEAEAGRLLLHVLRELGIEVPTLCHDDRLTPYGGCRLCLVERRDGRGGLVPACSTPVQRGMEVETDTPAVRENRRRQLQLLLLNHRMECPVCERRGDCRLQDLCWEHGVEPERLPFELVRRPRDESSPVILRDPEKCVLCGRCVRLCHEVQGVSAIGLLHRGLETTVSTMLDRPLDCEFCGQCVNACPVGALVAKPWDTSIPPWLREARTTACSFCPCGCEVTVEVHEERIVRVTGDPASRPNSGKLCAKGWLGWDVLASPDRLRSPRVRRNGRLVEATWDEALGMVEEAIRTAREAGREIGALAGPRLLVEDAILFRALWREKLGARGVAAGPVPGTAALLDGVAAFTGRPFPTASWEDVEEADVVVVLRADPGRTHPLLKTALVQKVRQQEKVVLSAHGLSGSFAAVATRHVTLHPGSEDVFLRGIARRLLDRGLRTPGPLERLPGFGAWRESLARYDAAAVEAACGAGEAVLDAVAGQLAAARRPVFAVLCGTGLPGDEGEAARAALELATLLRRDGLPGRVLVPWGGADLGGLLVAGLLGRPGSHVDREESRSHGWRGEAPRLEELLDAAGECRLGFLCLAAHDPVAGWPRAFRGERLVEGADFVCVLDPFETATARQADVVLPVRMLGERAGTLVSVDGTRRRVAPVVAPPCGLPGDGELLREIAARLDLELPSPADIERRIEKGIAALRAAPDVRFAPAPAPAPFTPGEGFLLDVGPQVFHSGTTTYRSPTLSGLAPAVALRLAPADARRLGVRGGDRVVVEANGRAVLLRARIDRTVRPGSVLAPWRDREEGPPSFLPPGHGPVWARLRRSE